MKRLVLGSGVILGVLMILGCGGVWGEAMKEAVVDVANETKGKVAGTEESPDRERVMAVLDEIKRNAKSYGVVNISLVAAEIEMAIEDGQIDHDESLAIEQAHKTAMAEIGGQASSGGH